MKRWGVLAAGLALAASTSLAGTAAADAAVASTGDHDPASQDCTASQLDVYLVPAKTGPTAGSEQVVFHAKNISTSVCYFGGTPRIDGLSATGTSTRLMSGSSSPDVGRPGILRPEASGKFGIVHLDLLDSTANCHRPKPAYAKVRIVFENTQQVDLAYPDQMRLSACFGTVQVATVD